jgi:hypothetical protein
MANRRFPMEVPERVPRLVALQVVVLGLLAPFTQSAWPIAFLAVDFAIRALVSPRYSLLVLVARNIVRRIPSGAGRPILYAPKRFAATLGFVFFTSALVLHLVPDLENAGRALAGMVIVLASLEAFAGVCVGCHIHAVLVRFGLIRAPACVSCGPSASAHNPR